MSIRNRVAGVDFSGARDAGKNIWIAEGAVGPGGVKIEKLQRAAELPNGSNSFEAAITALVKYVTTLSGHVVGFDFPFSLPIQLIAQEDWLSFAHHFAENYTSPDQFRDHCRHRTGGKEFKRATDTEARVPWCAYNLRLYRQTWAGIRHVLVPLVERGACVIPMQAPTKEKPVIAEICPASTLKAEGLYVPYKGRAKIFRDGRAKILLGVTRRGLLSPVRRKLRGTILDNPGGDALDAVLSAIAAARIDDANPRNALDSIESRVYF